MHSTVEKVYTYSCQNYVHSYDICGGQYKEMQAVLPALDAGVFTICNFSIIYTLQLSWYSVCLASNNPGQNVLGYLDDHYNTYLSQPQVASNGLVCFIVYGYMAKPRVQSRESHAATSVAALSDSVQPAWLTPAAWSPFNDSIVATWMGSTVYIVSIEL